MDGYERTMLYCVSFYVFTDALGRITDRLVSLWGAI